MLLRLVIVAVVMPGAKDLSADCHITVIFCGKIETIMGKFSGFLVLLELRNSRH
jgi:hypothetical protein